MRQYEEDVDNLNEVAHNRPRAHLVLGKYVPYRTIPNTSLSDPDSIRSVGS
jgi:hypothetical protein